MTPATEGGRKVVVLAGGWSDEPREIGHSIEYGDYVETLLRGAGYDIVSLRPLRDTLVNLLVQHEGATVFNALVGRYGEDGVLPSLLEFFGYSYTGCGPLACALARDKYRCAQFMESHGVLIPNSLLMQDSTNGLRFVARPDTPLQDIVPSVVPFPLVVKPNRGAFGQGMTIVRHEDQLLPAISTALGYDGLVCIQQYIWGSDAHVSVLSGRVLEIIESGARSDLPVLTKWSFTTERRAYVIPGRFSDSVRETLKVRSELIFRLLGCRGLTRCDYRVTPDGRVYFLEVNVQHSIRPLSMAVRAAAASGLRPVDLVLEVLADRWSPNRRLGAF